MSNGFPPPFIRTSQDALDLLGPARSPGVPQPTLVPALPPDPTGGSTGGSTPGSNWSPQHAQEAERLLREGQSRREAEQRVSQDRELVRLFRTFAQLDPDLAAEARAKGLDLGINAQLAEQDIATVRHLWEERKLRMALASGGSPALYDALMDPDFLKVARDDVENLSVLDKVVAQFSSGSLGNERSLLQWKKMQQGGRLSEADERKLDRIDAELARLPRDSAGHGPMSLVYGGSRMLGGMWEGAAAAAGVALAVGQLGPQVALPEEILTVPTAALAGSLTIGVFSGRQMAGEAYGEMVRLGITHGEAETRAKAVGIAGGLLEAGSLGFVGGKIASKAVGEYLASRASRDVLKQMTRGAALRLAAGGYAKTVASETGVELAQELIQWQLTTGALEKEGLEDTRGNLSENLNEVFWETLRGVAILSSFGPALQYRNNTRRAAEGVRVGEQLTDLGNAVQKTKLAGRDPNATMRFLAQSIEQADGPRDLIFRIDDFTQAMHEAGVTMPDLEASHPEVAASLRLAEADGLADFEIPTARFGAKFLSGDFGRALLPHARVEADGMTAFEAEEFQTRADELRREGAKILADEETATEQFREEVAEARQKRYAQLTGAGIRPREATTAASVHGHRLAVLADQLGMSPAEVDATYFGQVVSDADVDTTAPAQEQPQESAEAQTTPGAPKVPARPVAAATPEPDASSKAPAPSLGTGDARGRFFPGSRITALGPNANASTVLHEMMHEYANALFTIVGEGDPPAAIQRDVDAMLRFWKMEGETFDQRLAAWNALSFEEQAPHQEALTYNYELWLFNGTAPTTGLRRLFQRIRTFMIGVYSSLERAQRRLTGLYRANFGVDLPELSPEVRAMFETMLAGEQAAAQIEAVRETGVLFGSKEEFLAEGFTEEQWESYRTKMEDVTEAVVTGLSTDSFQAMQWSSRAQGRVLRELQRKHRDQRKAVKAEMEEQVRQEPLYQIFDLLKQETTGVDRDTAFQMLGADDKAQAAVQRTSRFRKNGVPPDDLAGFFPEAFPTGRDLVRAMATARTFTEEVEARTEAAMMERYGKAPTMENAQEQINRATHTAARARFVAAELKLLERSTTPARVLIAAAEEQARKILDRTKVADLYARRDTFAARERRAGEAARKALKPVRARQASGDRPAVEARDPDPRAAVAAKRQQLLYGQLAKLAVEARAEIEKARKGLFRRVSRGSNKEIAKTRDPQVVHIARALLGMRGLLTEGQVESTADFLATVEKYDPTFAELYDDALRSALGSSREFDHRQMTLGEFRVFHEMIDSLWFRSKRDREIEIGGKRMEIAAAVQEMIDGGLADRARADIRGLTKSVDERSLAARAVRAGNSTRTALTKVEHYVRRLDGGATGPHTRYLYREIKEAVTRYRLDAAQNVKAFVDLLNGLKEKGLLPNGGIRAELSRGEFDFEFSGMVELLGALLHMGNESNRSKFLVAGRGGDAWADIVYDKDGNVARIDYSRWQAFQDRMVAEGVLRKEHFDFAQAVWDLLDEIKPTLQRAHRKLNGYYFKEVKAQAFPVQFPDGTVVDYRGGYVPAGIDFTQARETGKGRNRELSFDDLEQEVTYGWPKVADGFTQSRVEGYRERPLSMNLEHIAAHIDKTLRYAHVQPAAHDMMKILTNKDFQAALAAADPDAHEKIFLPFLDRAVTQTLYKEGNEAVGMVMKHLRRINGVSTMALNTVNTLQQFTGLSNVFLYVKPRFVKLGLMSLLRFPSVFREMQELSPFMRDRIKNQMFDLTDEIRAHVDINRSGLQKTGAFVMRHGYLFQQKAQEIIDTVAWKGKFEEVMAGGVEGAETLFQLQERAVQEADAAVRLSQGSFAPEDVAAYEKATPAARAWMQFGSYFNTIVNQLFIEREGAKAKIAAVVLAFAIPAIVAEAIAMYAYDKWDDEDDDGHIDGAAYWELLVGGPLRGGAAMAPGFGPAAVGIYDAALGGRPSEGVGASPVVAGTTRALIGALRGVGKIADTDKELSSRDLRDILSLGALLIPGALAVAPFKRQLSYGYGVAAGQIEPTGVEDALRGMLTGYASQESRR